MKHGDHLIVHRYGYMHHGIYLDTDKKHNVIHFSGEPLRKSEASVRRTTLKKFLAGGTPFIREYYVATRPPKETVRTAKDIIKGVEGWGKYNLTYNNCEHFATFCKIAEFRSDQVEDVLHLVLVGQLGVVGLALRLRQFLAGRGYHDRPAIV